MIKKWVLSLFLLSLFSLADCKPPQLTPRDVKNKTEEILKAHVCYKSLNHELMGRVLHNYLDELDPSKTYFITPEIDSWLLSSPETLDRALRGFKTCDFSLFSEIHARLLSAIERRNKIEAALSQKVLPAGVKSEEFKDLPWAMTEEELETRILRIKALQLDSIEKMGQEGRDRFLQRAAKYRLNHESELIGAAPEDNLKVALSYLLKAVASSLDAHTNYFTPMEANQFMIQVQQRLFGIGAQLRDDLNGLTVTRILENSPASLSNQIKINDKIIAVNQEPIIGMTISDAVELIRGEKGSAVRLTILRETEEAGEKKEEKQDIELIRGEIVLEESRLETTVEPFADGAIATLHLFSFYQDLKNSSAIDIKNALEELKKEETLKGVILDLRNNAGGLLNQAVSVASLFIHDGIIVSIKDNTGKVQHLRGTGGAPIWEGPLLILVNRASASAAEIVAQTLQDYGRALCVGDDFTFGKGSFQTLTLDPIHHPKIDPQGEYKVTRGKYYTVSGKSPQLHGVSSDIIVPGLLAQLDIGEKFAKYPLENDSIEPHFEDDLSDIPPFQRLQLGSAYKKNLQRRLDTYAPHLEQLKKNSEKRIQANKNYQKFLIEVQKKNYDAPPVEFFNQGDLQMQETLNIMKDLIYHTTHCIKGS
jgi:carboxyl-terminal processing protease